MNKKEQLQHEKSNPKADRLHDQLGSKEYNVVNSKRDELNGKILERFGVANENA